jgi:hypothetical protein
MKNDKLSTSDYSRHELVYKCLEISEFEPMEDKMMRAVEILETLIIQHKKRVFIHDAESGVRSSTLIVLFLAIQNSMGLKSPN